MAEPRILLSKKEAASMLSISVRALDYLIQRREIKIRRIGRRVLVPRKEMEQFSRRDHLDPVNSGHERDR